MATQRPSLAVPLADFAAALLSQRELAPRAQATADQVAGLLPDSGVVVYVVDDQSDPSWSARGIAGEIGLAERVVAYEAGTLGTLAEKREPLLFPMESLKREDYAHLDVRRTAHSLAYLPILADDMLIGAVEIISYEQPLHETALHPLTELAEYAAIGIALAMAYEQERNAQLESITRITQMYDVEKVFNATLEMEELLALIPRKFHEILTVQAINLWMVDGDALVLTSRSGYEPTCDLGDTQASGGGIAAAVGDSGEPIRIYDPQDERLASRNSAVENGAIFTIMAAPLMEKESLVGVVEVINRTDGFPFDEDDEFLLANLCQTASNALHNASLLQAERKVEILQTLVQVSGEITSTLNLQRVTQAIVNGPQAVIAYDKAAIAVEKSGRLQLAAISGAEQVNRSDPDVKRLNELLEWGAGLNEEQLVVLKDGEVIAAREEVRAKFREYFAATSLAAVYLLPLADDQGRVGILLFESADPDFLNPTQIEMVKVLAAQATVALRNAQMYTEVPFIEVLEPILRKKHRFMAMEKRRRRLTVAAAVGVVLFLIAVPLPFRVDGPATVAPAHRAQVQAEVEGVVSAVHVREGQPVAKGTVLATLDDWQYRSALAAAEAKRATALMAMNRALAQNDGTEAGMKRIEADFWAAEVERARMRLELTQLRSPIDGVVATAQVENLVGRRLEPGDSFALVVDTSRAIVDVAVAESDVGLLRTGAGAAVKLDGHPLRIFRGDVAVVSPVSHAEGETRMFFARVSVPNRDGAVRTGMQGRSKISVGWRPAGYVMFRGIGRWFWGVLWSWFGW